MRARQNLKGFLLSIGGKTTQVGINLVQKWLENQLGL